MTSNFFRSTREAVRSPRWQLCLALAALPLAALLCAGTGSAGTLTPDQVRGASDRATLQADDPALVGSHAAAEDTSVERTVVPALRVRKTRLNLKSSSVVVMDAQDSSILYSKHADVPMPIASISKLLTALVVLEAEQPMDEVLTITDEDRDTEKNTTSRLTIGTELTRDDLFHLALMASENRAAHALARNYPGGMDAFIPAMNAKAKALGMTSAHFVEPTGLSSKNVSSAADLTKLVTAASRNPLIRNYSTYRSYAVPINGRFVEFHTTNSLVTKSNWDIAVQKTGYTLEAGRCLVMKTLIQDRAVVMVLLHSAGTRTRVADAGRIRKWVEAALALDDGPTTLRSQNLR